MDIDRRIKLRGWLERKYLTSSKVNNGNSSVIIKKNLMESDGVDIHTDGIIERSTEDFDMCVVSGYNYAMVCKFGKEFKYEGEPRIIVYCNKSSSWSYRKFKRIIQSALRKYQ